MLRCTITIFNLRTHSVEAQRCYLEIHPTEIVLCQVQLQSIEYPCADQQTLAKSSCMFGYHIDNLCRSIWYNIGGLKG